MKLGKIEKYLVLALILAGIIVRLYVFRIGGIEYFKYIGDYEVVEIGKNLAKTGVFGLVEGIPDSFRPPLYSTLIGVVYKIFEENYYIIIVCLQILCNAVTNLFIFLIAFKLFNGTVGIIATALSAFYPYSVHHDLTIIHTPLFTTLLVLTVYFILLFEESATIKHAFFVSLFATLSAYCRSESIIIIPITLIYFILKFRSNYKKALKYCGSLVLFTSLLLLPWTIRNFIIHKSLVIIATNRGYAMWLGNNTSTLKYYKKGVSPEEIVWCKEDSEAYRIYQKAYKLDNRLGRKSDNYFLKKSFEFIKTHRHEFIELMFYKFITFWGPKNFPSRSFVFDKWNTDFYLIGAKNLHLYYSLVLITAIIGIFLSRKFFKKLLFIYLIMFLNTLLYLFFIASTRFRAPFDSFTFILSAYGIYKIVPALLILINSNLKDGNYKPLIALIIISGILIRLYCLYIGEVEYFKVIGDNEYFAIGRNLVETGVYGIQSGKPDAFRPPLYPLIIGVIYKLFKENYFIFVVILQIFVNALTNYFIFLIGTLIFNKNMALIPTVLHAFYPYIIYHDLTLIDTPLFTFLLVLIFFYVIKNIDHFNFYNCLILPFLFSISTFLRSDSILIFFCFVVYLLFKTYPNIKSFLKFSTVIVLLYTLFLFPWVFRNYKLFNGLSTFISTQDGYAFWVCNNNETLRYCKNGIYPEEMIWVNPQPTVYIKAKELDGGYGIKSRNLYYNEGFKFLINNKKQFLLKFLHNLKNFWSPKNFPYS